MTDRLWWFVMWGARESTQTTPRDPGLEHRERVWGLGLAQLPSRNYHRVGCIVGVEEIGANLGKRLQSSTPRACVGIMGGRPMAMRTNRSFE